LSVTFTNTSLGSVTNQFWDFGDGQTTNTTETTVEHTYNSAGVFNVMLIASGDTGIGTNSIPVYINVTWLDTDSDGVPDWWMQQYFGHPTGQEADLSRAGDDADGDGKRNGEEYPAGTSPTDASSAFRITSIEPNPGGGFVIQWSSAAGKVYDVQRDTSLTWGTVLTLTNGVAATPPTNTYTDPTATNAPAYFFRVKVKP
jgi:PKD repeat protein